MIKYQYHMISINPGHRTTGTYSRNVEFAEPAEVSRDYKSAARGFARILGTDASRKSSNLLLAMRILFGILFIAVGILNLAGSPYLGYFPLPEGCSVVMVTAGALLMFGFLTRFAMLASFAMFCSMGIVEADMGLFPQMALMWGLASLAFCLAGPGTHSIDRGLALFLRRVSKR